MKEYDQYIGIAKRLKPLLPEDRILKLIQDLLDICRYNEYYAEWCYFVKMVDNKGIVDSDLHVST